MTLLKYKKSLAVITLLLSGCMCSSAFASNVGTVTRDSINVRAGDSTSSQVVGITNTGDSYAILDVEPGWVKVKYSDSSTAYIASLYVKVSEADASVIDHAVNVRSGPSTSAQVVGQVNVGDKVTVTGKSADGYWYKVNYNGQSAYISKDYLGGSYLYLVQSEANTTEKSNAQAQAVPVQPSVNAITGANTAENKQEDNGLSVEEILNSFKPADTDTYAIINSQGGLRLRSLPSTTDKNSNIITVLNNGYAVSVIEEGNGWLYVSDDYNNEGYISSEFASIKHGAKPENSGKVVFDKSSLTGNAAEIAEYALNFVGTPYVYGGTDLSTGVDCSGFVYCVYKHFGITLQRQSASQYTQGTYIDKADLQAGDLLFFNTGGNTNISHVGMYLGNGTYIHASTYSTGVITASLNDDYSTSNYVGAKRILN